LKFGENGEGFRHPDLKVQMMARAIYPDIKLNKQVFSFGEVAFNNRRDMTLTLKNKSKDLAVDFNFTKVAHFRCTPCKGKLFPDSDHHINVSFEPKAMGVFSSEIQMEILKGMYKIPIRVQGNSRAQGEKVKGVRGPGAKVTDF
jgi:hypothetical protein